MKWFTSGANNSGSENFEPKLIKIGPLSNNSDCAEKSAEAKSDTNKEDANHHPGKASKSSLSTNSGQLHD